MHICPKQHRKVYANTVTLCERLLKLNSVKRTSIVGESRGEALVFL